ncbi:MAG: hypothetical protein Q7S83_02295 [bacterium]|nr:hypothetical protein [bacterium]
MKGASPELKAAWKKAREVNATKDLSHLMSANGKAEDTKTTAVMTEFKDSARVVEITFVAVAGPRSLAMLPKMSQLIALAREAFPEIPFSDLCIEVGQPEKRCGDMVNKIYISEFHGFKYHVHQQHYPVLGG